MNKKRKDKLTFCVTCALIVALVIFSVNYYDNIALDEVAEGAVLGNVVQAGTLDDVVLEAVDAKKLVYVKAPEIDEIAIKYLHFSNENITDGDTPPAPMTSAFLFIAFSIRFK